MNPFTPLANRIEMDEEMDAVSLPDVHYARVLSHLSRVNRVTLAQRPTLAFVSKIMRLSNDAATPLRLLDVGFGHGDMLRAIAGLAARHGRTVELVGVDLNPRSESAARAATPATMPIRWITGDYRDLAGQGWDMIISSLVAHHMSDDERDDFLRFMDAQAARGWLVYDLHRQRIPFAGYPLLATMLLVDPIVRRDGQLSVGRSFRRHEWMTMLDRAGINGATISRWFPYRLCVERIR